MSEVQESSTGDSTDLPGQLGKSLLAQEKVEGNSVGNKRRQGRQILGDSFSYTIKRNKWKNEKLLATMTKFKVLNNDKFLALDYKTQITKRQGDEGVDWKCWILVEGRGH